MRLNTQDQTIVKNYLQRYRFLITEYEQVKQHTHPKFKFAKEFYASHGIDRRQFLKYYNRFKQSGSAEDLLPRKRGPRWRTRKIPGFVEEKIKSLRKDKTLNKFEIVNTLKPLLKGKTPSPSGVYNVLRRNNLNRLTPKMKENKRRIIKEKAGELAHADTHRLIKGIVDNDKNRYFLVGIIDSCTRIAWVEIVKDLKSLSVMFASLKCINMINEYFNIKFAEILTDNGPEFGPRQSKSKDQHPFERLLMELDVKHRYTRPYRPQTNGKIERFWKTIEEDLFDNYTFGSYEEMVKELNDYLFYYNLERPHQALDGQAPNDFNKNCPRII